MSFRKRLVRAVLGVVAGMGVFAAAPAALAADHGDSPLAGHDQACDIADVYIFLDPNDNNKVCLFATFRGFIAAGENANFGQFDPSVRYRFLIEQTDDAVPDLNIDVRFSRKTVAADAQIATVTFSGGGPSFTAPSTNSTIAATANPFVVTTRQGIQFFAGMVDDPFVFDIPAFARFTASVRSGTPDPTLLERGRDSFAGYNLMCIGMRMDLDVIQGSEPVIGAHFLAQRRMQAKTKDGTYRLTGKWQTIDRMGNPAVNVVLLPFARKDVYNQGTTQQDAAGRFLPFIAETLTLFGVDDVSIAALASVAIQKGDFLRLDTRVENTGNAGGSNAAAAFPNGRRLGDDVVDILGFFLNNRSPLGDSANVGDDKVLQNSFPFVALPHQPRNSGVDDNTRN